MSKSACLVIPAAGARAAGEGESHLSVRNRPVFFSPALDMVPGLL
jgi:hypothetical protein